MRPSSFTDATRLEPSGEGRFRTTLDAAWLQGRGAWGGVVAGWLVRALEATEPSRPVRSLTCDYCAPVKPGPVEVTVREQRRGTRVVFYAVEVLQRGRVAAHGTAVLADARDASDVADFDHATPLAVAPADTVGDWGRGDLPAYADHLRFRPCIGEMAAGLERALIAGWLAPRVPVPNDTAWIAALLDAWPPAYFARLDAPRAAGTVSLAWRFLSPALDVAPGEFLLVSAESFTLRDGYAEEQDTIHTPDGRLIARASQLIASY